MRCNLYMDDESNVITQADFEFVINLFVLSTRVSQTLLLWCATQLLHYQGLRQIWKGVELDQCPAITKQGVTILMKFNGNQCNSL